MTPNDDTEEKMGVIEQVLSDTDVLIQFAYQQGFKDIGYNPITILSEALGLSAAKLPEAENRMVFEAAWRKHYSMPAEIEFASFSDGRYLAPAIDDCYVGWKLAQRLV